MPRAICHLSLLFSLQESLRAQRPAMAVLMERHLAATLAGLAAPDALRIFAGYDKFSTHFYHDRDPATWRRAVETMCRMRPEVSDPRCLSAHEQAFVLGYISHLTVDEAFRETVTCQLSGNPRWQEIVPGLWSLADELSIDRPHTWAGTGLAEILKRISQWDIPSLVEPEPVQRMLLVVAEAVNCHSSWERELLHRRHFGNRFDVKDSQADWERRRRMAAGFFDAVHRQAFVEEAMALGLQESCRYWDGRYTCDGRR
ncbi:MAG: hypothetical protein ACE5LU_07025 [Anaerolineae bacterium]